MALSLKSLISGARDALPRLRFGPFGRDGLPAGLFVKSPEALELERMNPLRGVDEWRLGQIFDDARDGVFADLAWLYNEIEGVEPALLACCETRESAAGELGWVVRTADAERTRDFDETLADEQRAALLAEFGAVADDLPELAGHMVSAFFRGAAHALPLWDESGSLAGFRPLDLWNFALDRQSGLWYWNADASRDEGTFQAIPRGALVSLSASRHVDHAALPIFIRAALGAKRYGVWLDRFGIPPTAVIMPPNAERGEQAAYMDLARKFARGGSGILPNGSQVTYGTEARAVCPFPDFIRFQQQQIYAVGIGRVQSGETDGSNLGGNAAGVVDAALRRIVRRDARRIARALNDCVTRRVLARLFPGRPVLAQFAWDTEAKRTGREALEDAGLARAAGLSIDRAQLEEMTGYTLAEAPQPPAGGLPGAPGFGLNAQERSFHGEHQPVALKADFRLSDDFISMISDPLHRRLAVFGGRAVDDKFIARTLAGNVHKKLHPVVVRAGREIGGRIHVEIQLFTVVGNLRVGDIVPAGGILIVSVAVAAAVAVHGVVRIVPVDAGDGFIVPLVEAAADINGHFFRCGQGRCAALEPGDAVDELHIIIVAEDARRRFKIAGIFLVAVVAEAEGLVFPERKPLRDPFVKARHKHDIRVQLLGEIPLLVKIVAVQHRVFGGVLRAVVPASAMVVGAVPGGGAEAAGIAVLGDGDVHDALVPGGIFVI